MHKLNNDKTATTTSHHITWLGMVWYGLLPVVFIAIFALRFRNNSLIKYKTTYSHKRAQCTCTPETHTQTLMHITKLYLFNILNLIYHELKRAKKAMCANV